MNGSCFPKIMIGIYNYILQLTGFLSTLCLLLGKYICVVSNFCQGCGCSSLVFSHILLPVWKFNRIPISKKKGEVFSPKIEFLMFRGFIQVYISPFWLRYFLCKTSQVNIWLLIARVVFYIHSDFILYLRVDISDLVLVS